MTRALNNSHASTISSIGVPPIFFYCYGKKKTFRNPSHSFVLYLRFSRTLEMDLEICLIEGLRGLPSLFLLCTYEIVITLRFV